MDSAEKLGRMLNINTFEACVLVQKSHLLSDSSSDSSDMEEEDEGIVSDTEDALIDFCEEYWDAPKQPIVQLPDT